MDTIQRPSPEPILAEPLVQRSPASTERRPSPAISGAATGNAPAPAEPAASPSPTTGTFMLTFDCEGKWGLVDCLAPRHGRIFTTANLEQTYRRVTSLLTTYDIDATFAFTTAYCLTAQRFEMLRADLPYTSPGAQEWIRRASAAAARDGGQGWFVPACLDMVRERGRHEIGSHGFSHLPWRSSHATRADLDAELRLCRSIPEFSAQTVKTFVYPRNEIAHQELLAAREFDQYRAERVATSRAANLASELNLQPRSERLAAVHGTPRAVPAGYFLNWRKGLRGCIPAALTVHRWKNLLRGATADGGIVHAWTHPENFLDGQAMFPMLEEILRFVADEREAGRLTVATSSQLLARAAQTSRPRWVFPAPVDVSEGGPERDPGSMRASHHRRAVDGGGGRPLVSIGMPVLNGGAALHMAVQSVLSQTMTDWELLLMDDGSTDGETDAIAALDDPRIHVIGDGRNRGVAARLNEAIGLARGPYFARMDHDDISHPDRLRLQVCAMEADPTLDLLASRCIKVGEGDRFTGYMPFAAIHEEICRRPWLRIPMTHPSWMGRLDWFRQHRYPEPAPYYAEDFELLLRACDSSRFAALPQVLLAYRVRSRVDMGKSLRARRAQHALQRHYFSRKGQVGGAFMATATFFMRLGADTCRAGAQAVRLVRDPCEDVDPRDAAEWRRLIEAYRAQCVERDLSRACGRAAMA
jgi:peptidoglycan/xylan/chitin deacetylase (PgdA/CDA1 family)